MNQEPDTNQETDSLAGRLNMTGFRKHYVATMTADEEAWPQRERGSNLGRVFIIVLLLHVFVIGAVVLYNVVSPKTPAVAKAEPKPVAARNASTGASVPPPASPAKAQPPTPAPSASIAAAPAGKPADETGTYEVRTGDNLPGIAATLGVSAEELVKLNDLEQTELYPGRKIVYPKNSVAKVNPPASPAPAMAPLPRVNKPMLLAQNTSAPKKDTPPAKEKSAATPASSADSPPKAVLIKKADTPDSPPVTRPAKKDDSSAPPSPRPKTEPKTDKADKTEKAARDTAGKRTHLVTSKDTLYSISRKYGVKVDALIKANSIKDPTMLRDGSKLVIPAKN